MLAAAPNTVSDIIDKHGIACDADRVGSLHLAHSQAGLRDLKSRLGQQKKRNSPVVMLSAEETEKRTGTMAFHGSLYDPRAIVIQPFSYCRGMAGAAVRAGAKIHEISRVTRVERIGSKWKVDTDKGNVTSPLLINATGAYHYGYEGFSVPALARACYFHIATQPLKSEHLSRILPSKEGCWDTATVMSSFRLDRSGRLLVGAAGSLEHPGNAVHTNWAYRKMVSLFPFLKGQLIDYAWYGVIGVTRDHLPKILRLGENTYAAFGYSGRGIGPGTVFGKSLALFLLGKDPTVLPIAPVERFRASNLRPKQIYYETGCTLRA